MKRSFQSSVDDKNQSDLQIRKSAKILEFVVYGLIILVTIAIMLIFFNLILLG
jgi:hypothetical protein